MRKSFAAVEVRVLAGAICRRPACGGGRDELSKPAYRHFESVQAKTAHRRRCACVFVRDTVVTPKKGTAGYKRAGAAVLVANGTAVREARAAWVTAATGRECLDHAAILRVRCVAAVRERACVARFGRIGESTVMRYNAAIRAVIERQLVDAEDTCASHRKRCRNDGDQHPGDAAFAHPLRLSAYVPRRFEIRTQHCLRVVPAAGEGRSTRIGLGSLDVLPHPGRHPRKSRHGVCSTTTCHLKIIRKKNLMKRVSPLSLALHPWRFHLAALALLAALGAQGCAEASGEGIATSADAIAMDDSVRTLHDFASDRWPNHRELRKTQAATFFASRSLADVGAVNAAYVTKYGEAPEVTIRSDGLGQAVFRLSRDEEIELLRERYRAQLSATTAALADLLSRGASEALTAADRQSYFKMLPYVGLWDAPVRAAAHDRRLDAIERILLRRAWDAQPASAGAGDLDAALRAVEAKLPKPILDAPIFRRKSVALVVSSHGAQWQELVGWAKPMMKAGYHLQVFTPDGRPVALQGDSISVSESTAQLGFGCPADLDPAGETGRLADALLSNTASAGLFEAERYGAVYLVGGLGFNDDVAFAANGSSGLQVHANVAQLMARAIKEQLPLIAVCHAPTILAATPIMIDGQTHALNHGLKTASLPPFEGVVGITGRKEIQFTFDVNTHDVLHGSGGETDMLDDVLHMNRPVIARTKNGIAVITGPGPQTASALVTPTIQAMNERWAR